MAVIGAAMRKLVHLAHGVLKTGKPFNPELHEAMMAQPSDAAPNTVLAVIQRGYTLNGRLLRPARVVVSAAK